VKCRLGRPAAPQHDLDMSLHQTGQAKPRPLAITSKPSGLGNDPSVAVHVELEPARSHLRSLLCSPRETRRLLRQPSSREKQRERLHTRSTPPAKPFQRVGGASRRNDSARSTAGVAALSLKFLKTAGIPKVATFQGRLIQCASCRPLPPNAKWVSMPKRLLVRSIFRLSVG
jgi:hypothetical protein